MREELHRVGDVVHLAEPAETVEQRGRKKRAKTGRSDARLLRTLVMTGGLPESWIAPERILDLRARVGLRHALLEQRETRQQRIDGVLHTTGSRVQNCDEAQESARKRRFSQLQRD